MGLIVAVVMALTAAIITQTPVTAAMVNQVVDFGPPPLARFIIAAQNAVAALSEELGSRSTCRCQQIMKTGDFQSVGGESTARGRGGGPRAHRPTRSARRTTAAGGRDR